jgi:serine/threonine protein kinase
MEYMESGSLFSILHLQPQKRFPESTAKRYVQQVAVALAHLHSQQIVHRDIKPENLLMADVSF